MDNLNDQWKKARQQLPAGTGKDAELVLQRRNKKKSVLSFHYLNSLILSVFLVILILFFYHYTPFRTILSWAGVALMVGGLFVRIAVEIFSARKYAGIHVEEDTISATEASLKFYRFRKFVHGPVTITIVALYIVGFYMLSPEFSLYFSTTWMLIMDVGFAIGAVIMIGQIRKGILKEMDTLQSLTRLRNELDAAE